MDLTVADLSFLSRTAERERPGRSQAEAELTSSGQQRLWIRGGADTYTLQTQLDSPANKDWYWGNVEIFKLYKVGRSQWTTQSGHFISFSSVGSNSSSYYRSSYLDSSPSNNSYSSTYSYPSYESKYQALLNRNPDGAGKSRSGEFPPLKR